MSTSKDIIESFLQILQCENCNVKDLFKLCFNQKRILCDDCVENLNKEGDYEMIYEEIEKRINPQVLMVPNIPPAVIDLIVTVNP